MKKTILYGLMALMLILSVTAITQTQLESYTDNDIKTYLISNAEAQPVYYDQPTNNYIFSYNIKTIEKREDEYFFVNKNIEGRLDRNIWTLCRQHYNYNQCYDLLVKSKNSYSVNQQLRMKLYEEVRNIAKWRDNPTIEETLATLGGLTI